MVGRDNFADLRETVTVLVRVAGARNAYGNATWTDAPVDVPGCLIAPGSSLDEQDNADRTATTATIYNSAGDWPGGTVNRCRFHGSTWEIVGNPARWPGRGVVVEVRKVEG